MCVCVWWRCSCTHSVCVWERAVISSVKSSAGYLPPLPLMKSCRKHTAAWKQGQRRNECVCGRIREKEKRHTKREREREREWLVCRSMRGSVCVDDLTSNRSVNVSVCVWGDAVTHYETKSSSSEIYWKWFNIHYIAKSIGSPPSNEQVWLL